MTHVVNDRIAARAKELYERDGARLARERALGAKMAAAWLAGGPVKAGARFRPTRADRKALGA